MQLCARVCMWALVRGCECVCVVREQWREWDKKKKNPSKELESIIVVAQIAKINDQRLHQFCSFSLFKQPHFLFSFILEMKK